jgi:exopolysaccharide biosynthesis polyprenyl glycosylphosphotransferase
MSTTDRLQRETNGRSRRARIPHEVQPAVGTTASPPLPFLVESRPAPAVRRRDRAFRRALLVADVLAALIVVALNDVWLGSKGPSWTALLLPLLVPAVHFVNGMYDRDERLINKSTLEEVPAIFNAATLVTVVGFLLESTLLKMPIGAKVVAGSWIGLIVMVPACRLAARVLVREWMPPERCLVLGDNAHGRRLGRKITEDAAAKAELVGVLPLPAGDSAKRRPFAGHEWLANAVREADVHRVVIAGNAAAPQQELETIQAAKALGVKVSVVPRVLEVVGSSAVYDYVDGLTVLGVRHFGLSRRATVVKRVFDIAGSLLGLLLAGLLMVGIAVVVKLTSRGPVLFRQTRIGRAGKPFFMLKFRSMYEDADRLKDQLRDRNEADGLFKITDDPRITRVGRALRRTSLDELPQLLNVLRGEMSLVGPRPLVPEEDRQIQGWHRRRLQLTPGITGPWQVLGSARIPLHEMVTIDYLYVANWSLWGDIKVLLRTVGAVVARRGR